VRFGVIGGREGLRGSSGGGMGRMLMVRLRALSQSRTAKPPVRRSPAASSDFEKRPK